MRLEKDFEDFIRLLNSHNIRYLIVGAYAVSLYARPRNTGDIDFFIDNSRDNVSKLIEAIKEFGFNNLDLTYEDFESEDTMLQLGYEPVRIDILTGITGISFKEAYPNRTQARMGNQKTSFISLSDLITNKEATGRLKDKSDAELLRKFLED
ncbi:MAG: nucleotidyltransferase [Balneolaceae bacterium]|nr:nucleotidyltransferase [Balneolaceae bacterium]